MEKKYREELKEVEGVEELALGSSVPLGVNNPESVNTSNKQQAGEHSRNQSNDQSLVERGSKRRSKRNKNTNSNPVTFCPIDKKNDKQTNIEKKINQKKNKRTVTKQKSEVANNKPKICSPSTSTSLLNVPSRDPEIDKTKQICDDSNQSTFILKGNISSTSSCRPSSQNALITLYPHVGLQFFPESAKATPIPDTYDRKLSITTDSDKLCKSKYKILALVAERFERDTKINLCADKKRLGLYDPTRLKPKQKISENKKLESNSYPQPKKGKLSNIEVCLS